MLASLTRTLRDLAGLGDGEPAGERAADPDALAAARRQMDNKELLREAEERMGLVRALVDYTRNMRQYEAALAARAQAIARAQQAESQKAAGIEQFRHELSRRIKGLAAARQRSGRKGRGHKCSVIPGRAEGADPESR